MKLKSLKWSQPEAKPGLKIKRCGYHYHLFIISNDISKSIDQVSMIDFY